ncbi:MAG: SDR family oxidoreductase, partial [Lentisphaeria bacterium]|nr:SDR family oxidoreductase [Lentisphaeria bacterium]
NCAGYVHQGTALSTPLEEWDKTFAINSRGVFLVCEAFLPGMIEAGGGSIINMSSIASSEMGVANRFAYGASKAAVIGLTKCLAADFIKEGIRCNAICPATVDSPSLRGRINDTPDPVAARAAFIARQPMGRIGKPEEIAEVATYLACDLSEYMTGQAIVLDGGMHL